MKKAFKIIGIVILSICIFCNLMFCVGKHGWRLFGFDLCENPDVLYIEHVCVTDETVHILGNTMSSASSFVGYTYKIKDDVLYVGMKENLLLGFKNRLGSYSFVIEDNFKNINAIYIVNSENEKCIWTMGEDKK